MSTGLLYHGWGVRGYVYESTHYVAGEVVFWVRKELEVTSTNPALRRRTNPWLIATGKCRTSGETTHRRSG